MLNSSAKRLVHDLTNGLHGLARYLITITNVSPQATTVMVLVQSAFCIERQRLLPKIVLKLQRLYLQTHCIQHACV